MTSQAIGGIAIKDAFKILHMDKRWFGKPASMTSYVFPGCGYGGYCLPKDISAMVSISEKSGHVPELLKAVIKTNGKIKNLMADHVIKNVDPEDYVGILGLAFKPNSDDVRDSPSKDIIQCLLAKGHKKILAYDPMAMNNFKQEFKFPIEYAQDLPSCLQKVKNVLILTGWKDFVENRALMAGKKIFDFRYIL
jgi:UDPglucose 6-dehydrogenase